MARRDRALYLIDTFAGPVVSQFSDDEISEGRLEHALCAQRRGAYVDDLARIEADFEESPNVKVIQGVVPDVLSTLDVSQWRSYTYDMNCAYPEASALRFFWPLRPLQVEWFCSMTTPISAMTSSKRPSMTLQQNSIRPFYRCPPDRG